MSERPRVGILISGRGSNMTALIEAMREGTVPATPAVVVSNVPGAPGLDLAARRGVAVETLDHCGHGSRAAHERALVALLTRHGVDWVCLAGYMRLLGPTAVEAYRGRMLNIHPSLLPAFPGLHAPRQALAHGVKVSGCTVHFVDEACDHGPIVAQAAVPVFEDDDEERLAARILEQEHRLYPGALALAVAGRLSVRDRRVFVAG